jgi:hypothetical protein
MKLSFIKSKAVVLEQPKIVIRNEETKLRKFPKIAVNAKEELADTPDYNLIYQAKLQAELQRTKASMGVRRS